MLRTMLGRFSALRRKPQSSSSFSRCSKKLQELGLGRRPRLVGHQLACRRLVARPGTTHSRAAAPPGPRLREAKPGLSGTEITASASAICSLTSPMRSGPKRMPHRLARADALAHLGRGAARGHHPLDHAAMARGGGIDPLQIGDRRLRVSKSRAASRRYRRRRHWPPPWRLGQPSRGFTSRRSARPQLSMARAAVPIFSPSCGSTRMIAGPPPRRPACGRCRPSGPLAHPWRHPRESGDPGPWDSLAALDSRFRGNDDGESEP